MELVKNKVSTVVPTLANLLESQFTVFDVGCSGGLDPSWRSFGSKLDYYGFDPVIDEVTRLNSLEKNNRIHYFEGFVVGDGTFINPPNNPWNRLSAAKTNKLLSEQKINMSDTETLENNLWDQLKLSNNKIKLSNFVKEKDINRVDFLKIDVDGGDLDVLKSFEENLKKVRTLGVCIEVNYYGTGAKNENTFHNIERLMQKNNFTLIDFSKRLYSISALPSPYEITIPAQTKRGRCIQGDALYIRDYVGLSETEQNNFEFDEIIKIACLFALFGHEDSCLELIQYHEKEFKNHIDIKKFEDSLVENLDEVKYLGMTYAQVINNFEQNSALMYPSSGAEWVSEKINEKVTNRSPTLGLIRRMLSKHKI